MANDDLVDERRDTLIVFACAFAVRLWFLSRWAASPFFHPVTGGNDRSLYDAIAHAVASGQIFPEGVFQYMPLYGWWLGFIYAIAGASALAAAGLLGCILDSLTTILIFKFARSLNAHRFAAMGAALLYAFYPLAIVYSVLTMPNTLNAFLLLLFATQAHRLEFDQPLKKWLLVGLLAGVTALSFAGMLLIFIACLAYWIGSLFRCGGASEKRQTAQHSCAATYAIKPIVCLLAAALPIVPIAIHNYRAEGQFVLITAHGGFNFYMGNHEGATGYPVQIKNFRGDQGSLLADAMKEAIEKEGRALTSAEFSKHWSNRAKDFIRENPNEALKLFVLKIIKFFNYREYDDMRLLPLCRLTNLAFNFPLWPGFGIISVLGLTGLFVARRCALLKLITVTGIFSLVLFFITSRYRLTFAPLLCVLGGVSLDSIILVGRSLRERRGGFGETALPLVFFSLSLCFIFLPVKQADFRALDHYNAAVHLLDRGLANEALEQAIAGARIAPTNPDLHFVIGNAFFGLGQLKEAEEAYLNTARLNPHHVDAHFNLAVVYKNTGKKAQAIQQAQEALKLEPNHARASELLKELQ